MRASELAGVGVLVTRPLHQARGLAEQIEAAGGTPVLWPTLAIAPPRDPAPAQALLGRIAGFDLVVFVSANAVTHGLAALPAPLPEGVSVAVVGEGTARTLKEQTGRQPQLMPEGRYDSEGLLALPALQDMRGRRVLIVRGEGGRELLAQALRARGAEVEYAEVYRRLVPDAAPPEAWAALAESRVHVVTATSSEGLRNLVAMAGALTGRLLALPLVVAAERQRAAAAELGFHGPILVADNADDTSVAAAVARWRMRGWREGMSEEDDTPQSAVSGQPGGGALVTRPPVPLDDGRHSSRTVAIAALVVALAASGAAAYLWNALDSTRARAATVQSTLSEQLESLQSTTARQEAELEKALQDTEASITQRQALKAAVDDLRARLSRDRSDWLLAEVDYLLTIANRRLRFERDIPSAVAALEEADVRLQTLQEPALVPVRAAIANELQRLRSVPGVDRSGLALQVTALINSVGTLPLAAELGERPAGTPAPAEKPAVHGWHDLVSAMWEDIKGLVTVRRRDQPIEPLLPPEQRYFLQQNLALKLETARLALLQRDPDIYKATLAEADAWARQYFNVEAASTDAFLQGLARVQKSEISPALPDIGASLRELRRIVRELTPPRAEGET